MQLPGRKFTAANSGYRYGFNGKENDNDVKGEGNQQDYGMRIYDPRLGKFLSVDPLTKDYPELTPYQFASNSPIESIDLDGLESLSAIKSGLYNKFQAELRVASTPPPVPEKWIAMRDVNGRIWEGPESHVEGAVAAMNREYHEAAVAANIVNTPTGSLGYMVAGEKGAEVGNAFGGVLFSFGGGLPEKSNISPKRTSTVESEPARTEKVNTPSATTNKQVNVANGKAPTDGIQGTTIINTPAVNSTQVKNTGKGTNHLKSDPTATGSHTSFQRDNNKLIFKYQEFMENLKNPLGFQPGKRFDGGMPNGNPGAPHTGVPTPHVQDVPKGPARTPTTTETPQNTRFKKE